MIRWDRIWRYNGGAVTYTDLTDYQRLDSAFTIMAATTDYLYLGLSRRAIGFVFEVSTGGSYAGLTFEYYSDSGAWKKCSLLSSTDLDIDEYCVWLIQSDMTPKEFTATSPHTATPPETGLELFWYRINAATTVTTAAILSKIRAIPYVTYASADDVAALMQIKGGFDYKNTPTVFDVENKLRQKESHIDWRTSKSWKFNYSVDEEYPFNINGIKLQGWPIINMYSLSIWNGGSWETKTMGRSSDYFTIDQYGILKFSRFFALPARFAYVPPGLGRYDFGEFAFPVHISYAWGNDPEKSKTFHMVNEIATKAAACDIYTAYDKTVYTRSGIDKVTYDRKIETWRKDVEDKIDELRAVFTESD